MSPDERLLCHCPSRCAERATQEDGLCDTCRPATTIGLDPSAAATDTSVVAAHSSCVHLREPGSEPGSRSAPIPYTTLDWTP